MNAFTRSWEITKLTFGVMRADKELAIYPILSPIVSFLVLAVLAVPALLLLPAQGGDAITYVLLFIIYLVLAVVSTFFNVCVVYTAAERFAGRDATVKTSLSFAFSRLGRIIQWGLLAATVGLILRVIESSARRARGLSGLLLTISSKMLGVAWRIASVFVVPSIVYHDTSPIGALQDSIEAIKKTWGESLIRYYGLGLIEGIAYSATFFGSAFITVLLVAATNSLWAVIVGIALFILLTVAIAVVFRVANGVFNTALFVYAHHGVAPGDFSAETLQGAFVTTNKTPAN